MSLYGDNIDIFVFSGFTGIGFSLYNILVLSKYLLINILQSMVLSFSARLVGRLDVEGAGLPLSRLIGAGIFWGDSIVSCYSRADTLVSGVLCLCSTCLSMVWEGII